MLDSVLYVVEIFIWINVIVIGGYYMIFSIASLTQRQTTFPDTTKLNRFAILIPVDSKISKQNYPTEAYTIIEYTDIISAVATLDANLYDITIILGKTERTSKQLLKRINNAFSAGAIAAQLHHVTENISSYKQRRLAEYEEVRNIIFKLGHNKLGLSSSLDRQDFAINTEWLKNNLIDSKSNLENRLLHEEIYIYYLEDANIYSSNARPAPKHFSTWKALRLLPTISSEGIIGYFDKLIRSFLPSMRIIFGLYISLCIFITTINITHAFKWWFILFLFILIACMAIPDYVIKDRRRKNKTKQKISKI